MRLALGELLEGCDIVANESFLLGPAPSLEPSFTLDGIRDAIKPLRKDQFDRQAGSRVSRKRSSIVLGNSCLKRRTRRAYIQAAIAASNDVEIRSFRHVTILRDGADSRPSFETRATARSSG
jgi:hypothetical protein